MTVFAFKETRGALTEVPDFPNNAIAITKSDTDTYNTPITVYVGGAGDVAILPVLSDTAVTFSGLSAGSLVPCKARKVMSTNTTATLLLALC